ncbi:MAG: citrate lyase subunit alpha [Desulfobacterales bacterium]
MSNTQTVTNHIGRRVPIEVNGQAQIPYQGVDKFRPSGRKYGPPIATCADYPQDGNKLQPDLKAALIKAGLKDGMTISTHHHFRNGDLVANRIFDIAAELGIKDLVWAPSASFPCHKPIIKHLQSNAIHHIEGSMNGDLGRFCSEGNMRGTGVLRSHGGRYQAIQDGELKIDIAVIAASAADSFGNANGLYGPAACGLLGFALADSMYADKVIVVTDNPVPFPCIPWQIQGNNVDFTVTLDRVGIPEKIISGTTQVTKSPDRLLLAEMTARFCEEAGLFHPGFSFQAGAGGTALAIGIYFAEVLKRMGFTCSFARGGSNRYLVQMLEAGLTEYILDGQTFDLEGVRSMRENQNHVNTSPFTSYNYHGKGNFASMLDVAILGATEVDINFNGNVVTHSDGYLLHGIGGWQNCLFGKCVILPIPLFRNRIPVIRESVTTLCGPGELIDVIVTERGIAINPKREDLLAAVKHSSLPIKPVEELKEIAERICGKPAEPELGDEIVAVIKWVDGTVIDAARRVKH